MKSREKILRRASDLIHEKGFRSTSIQDILAASNVTKSNFYYHFQSKEQLAFEILAERMRQFYAFAIGPTLDNPDLEPRARIEAFIDRIRAIGDSPVGDRGCPFGNLAQEVSTLNEPLRESLSRFFEACTEALERAFEEGRRAGLFREGLPSRELAEFALAQVQGAFLLRKTHRDPGVMDRSLAMLRTLLAQWS